MFILKVLKNEMNLNKNNNVLKYVTYFKNEKRNLNKTVANLQYKISVIDSVKDLTVKTKNCTILKVNYIFCFNISNSNIIFNMTDTKGNTLFYITSGILKYNGSQKTNKHTLLTIITSIVKYINFFKKSNVALHFRGSSKKYNKLIINYFKTVFKILIIKSYNLPPHNGCRPRKLKRLKKFSF